MMRTPHRSAGFSLLEVLLAITLLAVLLAGAMGGIRAATRAMHSGEQNIERTNRLRVAQEFIRRELGHSGVGCGTFEMYGASYGVESVRVRDVLFGPRPEVIVIARGSRGRQEILCTTDVSPPVCTRGGDITALPRFRRPDVVISGMQRYRLVLPASATTRVP